MREADLYHSYCVACFLGCRNRRTDNLSTLIFLSTLGLLFVSKSNIDFFFFCVCQVPTWHAAGSGSQRVETSPALRTVGARWASTLPGPHEGTPARPLPLHELHVSSSML